MQNLVNKTFSKPPKILIAFWLHYSSFAQYDTLSRAHDWIRATQSGAKSNSQAAKVPFLVLPRGSDTVASAHTHLIALKRWQLFRRPTLQHFNWCKTPNWLNALIWEGHTGLFQQTLGMLLLIYSPIHPTYYTPEWMQKYKTNAACFGNKVHAIPRYKNRKSTLRKTFAYWRFSQLSKNTCKKKISIEA